MRIGLALLMIAGAAFIMSTARAFPDGAPWGAANPAAEQHCASCHFEAEPVRDSGALHIDGLPPQPAPDEIYELRILFEDPDIITAGFQLFARAGNDEAGTFTSMEADIEFVGSAIRSTAPAKNDNGVTWAVEWHSPREIASPIYFYVAACAANDDGSPFGDTIHYRTYRLMAK